MRESTELREAGMTVRTETFDAVIAVLRDGAWHSIDDLREATRFPEDWVDELRAEGLLDVDESLVTMVRLRPGNSN
jgi:hypothetical protein